MTVHAPYCSQSNPGVPHQDRPGVRAGSLARPGHTAQSTAARTSLRGHVKRAALLVAAVAAAAPLAAQQRDTVPTDRVHVVRPGETLWDIARVYLNDPFLWPEIFRINTDVVEDPALIYPNERLAMPAGAAGAGADPTRTVFYQGDRQAGPRDRFNVQPAGTSIFPVVRLGDFYRAAFLARDAEVQPVGRVAELISPTVVPMDRQPNILIYDRVYVALTPDAQLRIGDRVQFLRSGRELLPHGRVFISTGVGTVAAVDPGVATVVVVGMFDQMAMGDLAVPYAVFPVRPGVRPAASSGLQARILGFEKPHALQAVEEIAFIDVGREAGVREGDEFEVYLPREGRDWGTRPEIPVARMQVVKVTRGTASARITSIDQPAVAVGLPVRRTAAMPAR